MDKRRASIRDCILIFISFPLCLLNKLIRFSCPVGSINIFLRCYFNDLIGSIGFAAFCDFLLRFGARALDRYWKVFVLMLSCGFSWEVVTPLFRPDSVGDFWDAVAYIAGGTIFYGISVLTRKKGASL